MDVASYVLISHQQALRRRMDVTANNMANLSTAGFKREQPLFHEFVETGDDAPIDAAKRTSFVLDYGAVHDSAAGSYLATANPLDVMIEGPGYLAVEAPGGGTAYTRDGYLKVRADGALVADSGVRVLGEGGRPISVPTEEVGSIVISNDGTVSGRTGPLGRIAVTVFASEADVDPRGDGLMRGSGGRELPAAETRLRSGGVEASNVQPIIETSAMVDILRAYQTSQRINDSMSDMRKRAIEQLGRVS